MLTDSRLYNNILVQVHVYIYLSYSGLFTNLHLIVIQSRSQLLVWRASG